MYRARAEKVSGSRVFANGKWLTCIGNKPVAVGDLIFTDGKCVYGFYQESQQPMVITSPKVEVENIPIITQNNLNVRQYYNYRNGTLKEIETENKDTTTVLMINGYNDEVYFEKAPYGVAGNLENQIVAANVDKQGNLYRMIVFSDSQEIKILKNDKIIKTAFADTKSQFFNVSWAFIENENDWAFIVGKASDNVIAREYTDKFAEVIIDDDGSSEIINDHVAVLKLGYSGSGYFYNSKGVSTCISKWSGIFTQYGTFSDNYDFWFDHTFPTELEKIEENFSGFEEIKFPMQDGYYFKIHNVLPMPLNIGGAPWIVTKNIYTPNNTLIFSGIFPFSSYLTIYKNLIGVRDNNYLVHNVYESDLPNDSWQSPQNLINSGVYQLVDGKLNSLLAAKNAFYSFLNQRLRPMKNYQNWTNNLVDCTYLGE